MKNISIDITTAGNYSTVQMRLGSLCITENQDWRRRKPGFPFRAVFKALFAIYIIKFLED